MRESTGYLTLTRIAGDPGELLAGYRSTAERMDEVGRDHGLILHAAAGTDDGLLIVNVWPSRDGSESAARDPRRLTTVREHGLAPGRMSYEHHDLDGFVLFEREPHRVG
jgi:hypothetical protein